MQRGVDQRQLSASSQDQRATQQLSNEIEDMVLSAFGFTRAAQPQQPQQQPSSVVRSADLVSVNRPSGNIQQSTVSRPAAAADTGVSFCFINFCRYPTYCSYLRFEMWVDRSRVKSGEGTGFPRPQLGRASEVVCHCQGRINHCAGCTMGGGPPLPEGPSINRQIFNTLF